MTNGLDPLTELGFWKKSFYVFYPLGIFVFEALFENLE